MKKLLFNTKTLKQNCALKDFIENHYETLHFLQKIIYEKVSIYGDFDFFSESYFCGLTRDNFIAEIRNNSGTFSKDEKVMLFNVLHKVREDDSFLSNIHSEELSISGNSIDAMSTESLSFNNKIHQIIFSNTEKFTVEVQNKINGENFEIFLINKQWNYNVFREVNLLSDDYDVSRVFQDTSMTTIAFANSFEEFKRLDRITQKDILIHIMKDWPVLILDGGRTLGTRFVQPVTSILSNASCYEYRLKCNEKQYRIYFTINSGKTYILADYYKRTQNIPNRIKERIKGTNREI